MRLDQFDRAGGVLLVPPDSIADNATFVQSLRVQVAGARRTCDMYHIPHSALDHVCSVGESAATSREL